MVFWLGCVGFIIGNLMGVATAIPAAMQRYESSTCVRGGAQGLFLGAWRAEHTGSAISVVVGQVEGNAVALAVLILFNVRIMMTMGVSFKTVRGHSTPAFANSSRSQQLCGWHRRARPFPCRPISSSSG